MLSSSSGNGTATSKQKAGNGFGTGAAVRVPNPGVLGSASNPFMPLSSGLGYKVINYYPHFILLFSKAECVS